MAARPGAARISPARPKFLREGTNARTSRELIRPGTTRAQPRSAAELRWDSVHSRRRRSPRQPTHEISSRPAFRFRARNSPCPRRIPRSPAHRALRNATGASRARPAPEGEALPKGGVQHEDFPGGHPSSNYSRPSTVNCRVLMGSGALALVGSHPSALSQSIHLSAGGRDLIPAEYSRAPASEGWTLPVCAIPESYGREYRHTAARPGAARISPARPEFLMEGSNARTSRELTRAGATRARPRSTAELRWDSLRSRRRRSPRQPTNGISSRPAFRLRARNSRCPRRIPRSLANRALRNATAAARARPAPEGEGLPKGGVQHEDFPGGHPS